MARFQDNPGCFLGGGFRALGLGIIRVAFWVVGLGLWV